MSKFGKGERKLATQYTNNDTSDLKVGEMSDKELEKFLNKKKKEKKSNESKR